MIAGDYILKKHGRELITPSPEKSPNIQCRLDEVLTPGDFGTIVATAALAHDLGNPPFGHSGEDAVRNWFCNGRQVVQGKISDPWLLADFKKWEGNAQGFRIMTKLQLYRERGGMRLSYVTLAAFTKYPFSAEDVAANPLLKKHGFFAAEAEQFQQVARGVGLLKRNDGRGWCRHPLAYLMEAADDICYRIVDFEDGHRLGRIPYHVVEAQLMKVATDVTQERLAQEPDESARVSYLRARSIRALVEQVADVFAQNEDAILQGIVVADLISLTKAGGKGGPLAKIKSIIKQRVYTAPAVLETEAAGFEIIGGLLDTFSNALELQVRAKERVTAGELDHRNQWAEKILQLIPEEFVGRNRVPAPDAYTRLLRITDYVSGMTDTYALSLYRRLKGIALPA
jgi:dGTPase